MRRCAAGTVALILALALGGCAAETPEAPEPTPTPSALFGSDEEALAAATNAYLAYVEVVDRVGASGGVGEEELADVAGGTALEQELDGAASYRSRKVHTTGSSGVDSVKLLNRSDDEALASVELALCLDVSATDVLNADGVSVLSGDRPLRFPLQVTLEEDSHGSGRLLVIRSETWTSENFC